MTSTRSAASVAALAALLAPMLFLLGLQLAQIIVEAIEALLPESAIAVDPIRDFFEADRLEPARPPLRVAAARDQAGALQHLQVLGHGGGGHGKGLRQPRAAGPAQR